MLVDVVVPDRAERGAVEGQRIGTAGEPRVPQLGPAAEGTGRDRMAPAAAAQRAEREPPRQLDRRLGRGGRRIFGTFEMTFVGEGFLATGDVDGCLLDGALGFLAART